MEKKKTDINNQKAQHRVSEWMKKTLLTGVGAVFMTEEGIRNALVEMNLPKSVVQAALAQAERRKSELTRLIANEVGKFLNSLKLDETIRNALNGQSIEITAKIKFKSDEKIKVKVKKESTAKKKKPLK